MAREVPRSTVVSWALLAALLAGVALNAAAPPPRPATPEQIEGLVRRLGADEFSAREESSRRLASIGRRTLPTLRRFAADRDPEVRERVKSLLTLLDGGAIALRAKGAQLSIATRDPEEAVTRVLGAGKQFGDDDMLLIGKMPRVESISFNNTSITHEGLRALANLPLLYSLTFSNSRVGGPGIRQLKNLQQLNDLSFSGAGIEDEHMAVIAALPSLHVLGLQYEKVTDRGVAKLQHHKKLTMLWLPNTQITDEGLKSLGKIKTLWHLDLSGTAITDEGLKHLLPLTELRLLYVGQGVSQEAFDAFTREMPNYGKW